MYLSIYAIETICSGIKKKLKDVIWAMTKLIEEMNVYIIPWRPTSHEIKRA